MKMEALAKLARHAKSERANEPIDLSEFAEDPDQVYREAQAFRRMSGEEQGREFARVIEEGQRWLETSPDGPLVREYLDQQEAEWHRIQRELIARHLAKQEESPAPLLDEADPSRPHDGSSP